MEQASAAGSRTLKAHRAILRDPLPRSPKVLNARRSAAQIPSITVFRAGDSDDPSQKEPGMDAKAKELATYLAESIQT